MKAYVLTAISLATTLFYLRFRKLRERRIPRTTTYPPGPKGLPIVGNFLDMPGKDEWETARQWGKQYGDIVSVKVFGTRYMFLNSYEATVDLLEKRGNIYSSRPKFTMIDLEGWTDWNAAMMPYGDELRLVRQFLHSFFQLSVTKDYYSVHNWSTLKLLLKLLETPNAFSDHIRCSAAESIIMVTYGYEIIENDPYIELVTKGMEAVTEAQTFFLVNALPALRHLPAWFPGAAGFHKRAKEGYKLATTLFREPYDKAKRSIANGTAVSSITSRLIDTNTIADGSILDETVIEKVVGVAYLAGGDTTVSVLLTFFLAMVLYPEAMRKGQQELDRVIGKDNLPTFEDRTKLPYINAICKECLRWQTVTPLGLAHCTESDDTYNGYFIPAGTTIFPNVWAMLRNPKEYPEPDKFIPERWLAAKPPMHPNKMAFGFGRRICPGMYFAENAVFLGIASILAAFDIEKAIDASGAPITPVEVYTSNIVRHPKPFECKVTPRSDNIATLIRATAREVKLSS